MLTTSSRSLSELWSRLGSWCSTLPSRYLTKSCSILSQLDQLRPQSVLDHVQDVQADESSGTPLNSTISKLTLIFISILSGCFTRIGLKFFFRWINSRLKMFGNCPQVLSRIDQLQVLILFNQIFRFRLSWSRLIICSRSPSWKSLSKRISNLSSSVSTLSSRSCSRLLSSSVSSDQLQVLILTT